MEKRVLDLLQPFYHNCPGATVAPLPRVQRVRSTAAASSSTNET